MLIQLLWTSNRYEAEVLDIHFIFFMENFAVCRFLVDNNFSSYNSFGILEITQFSKQKYYYIYPFFIWKIWTKFHANVKVCIFIYSAPIKHCRVSNIVHFSFVWLVKFNITRVSSLHLDRCCNTCRNIQYLVIHYFSLLFFLPG